MKIEWKSCFRICVSVFLLYLYIIYWKPFVGFWGTFLGAAMPLLIGCVVAYIINILMSFYEKHYFPHTKSNGVAKSCLLAIAYLLSSDMTRPAHIECDAVSMNK